MKTDFNSSEEIFTALVGGLKLTNKNFGQNEYLVLGNNDKPYLHLKSNTGKEYSVDILSQVPIKDWKIWSEPVNPKFKAGDFVYDKYAKRIIYVLDVSRYEREIAQFVYLVFDGAREVYVQENRLVDFNLIKKQL